jgi:glycerophosphoryl diester phosphodiesterase
LLHSGSQLAPLLYLTLLLIVALAAPGLAAEHARSSTTTAPSKHRRITVIAHRGNSAHAPENTLSAFRGGLETKADYVELDSHPSADGTLWVLHDKTLDRTTDILKHVTGQKIKITSIHDDLLRRLDAGAWFGPAFQGEKLPTLAESLDLIQKSGKTLLERKDGDAAAYAELLKSKRLVGKLIVQAFDWDFLEKLHKLLPDQPRPPARRSSAGILRSFPASRSARCTNAATPSGLIPSISPRTGSA